MLKRSPIKKRRSKARRGPLRDKEYLKWIRQQRCIGLNYNDGYDEERDCMGGLFPDPAHTVNNGTSSKGPDSSCVPLCRKHHMEYDAERKAFESKYNVNMKAIAAEHYARFKEQSGKPNA